MKAEMTSDRPAYLEAVLSVLGYQEDGEWVALALEMDLRGYGDTWESALDELRDLVVTQISFAHFKGEVEMIWRSAEPEYWERFREALHGQLAAALQAAPAVAPVQLHAGGLEIPAPHVIAAQRAQFARANG
jgi:hypothetical protein